MKIINAPAQNNSIDCGIFVIAYCEYMTRKSKMRRMMDFGHSNVDDFRLNIASTILLNDPAYVAPFNPLENSRFPLVASGISADSGIAIEEIQNNDEIESAFMQTENDATIERIADEDNDQTFDNDYDQNNLIRELFSNEGISQYLTFCKQFKFRN